MTEIYYESTLQVARDEMFFGERTPESPRAVRLRAETQSTTLIRDESATMR